MRKRGMSGKIIEIALFWLMLCSMFTGTVSADVNNADENDFLDNVCCAASQASTMPNDHSLFSEIDDALENGKQVFVFFYTDWCHFCHQQMPIVKELENEYAEKLAFMHINADERPHYAELFSVTTFPTMFVITGKKGGGYIKQEISGSTEQIRLRGITDSEIGQSEQTDNYTISEGTASEDADDGSRIGEVNSNPTGVSPLSNGGGAGNYELLIIAPDEFIDELKPLKDFKDATGRPTILLRLGELYSNPSCTGVDEPEMIKNCIAHYQKSNGIKHVMLVGDVDKLPVRWRWWGFVKYHPNGTIAYDQRGWAVSDLYYADLYNKSDGSFEDWDSNNNRLYGEIEFEPDPDNCSPNCRRINNDNIDFVPDVAVGRVPASTSEEVVAYVNKVITYELDTHPTDTWFKTAGLYTGCWMEGTNATKDEIGVNLTNNGFTVLPTSAAQRIRYGYWYPCPTPDNPDKRCCNSPLDMPNTIIGDINSGVGFVNYIGHGNTLGFACLGFGDSQIINLTNSGKLSVTFAGACDTGTFAPMPRVNPYKDVSGNSQCAGQNITEPYPYWNLPRPNPLQQGSVTCNAQIFALDLGCFAENFLFGRAPGQSPSSVGAIAYLGARSGGQWGMPFLDKFFFQAYTSGHEILGDVWRSMVTTYYWDRKLNEAHTWVIRDDWGFGHGFDEPQKLILFGDPSLVIGGIANKEMSITHDTTLSPTTYHTHIRINASHVVLDCKGATIKGTGVGNGILIPSGVNNVTIKNCNVQNFDTGIFVGSNSNTIINTTINSNQYGIYLVNGAHNNIISNSLYSNDKGIYLNSADFNEIRDNSIYNNTFGVYFDLYSNDNILVSNMICSNSDKDISNNVNYGSNYGDENMCSFIFKWNDNGTFGCTHLCNETPTEYYCDSCSDCTNKINNAPPGSVIKLTKNILNHHGTCIDWEGDHKTFDGQNHIIDGDDSVGDPIEGAYHTGIDLSFGPEGNTIKNCVISDFEYGIRIQRYFGISSYYNKIIDNMLYSNVHAGIDISSNVDNSDDSIIIKDNIVINNNKYGITIYNSNKNLIDSNTVCSNTISDFLLSYSYNNFGTDNYCDKQDGWNDAGEMGCSKSCGAAPMSCSSGEVIPYNDMEITANTRLCRGFYNIPDSDAQGVMIIKSDNVILDCNGATINGTGTDAGISIYNNGFDNVITKNCNLQNYKFGIGTVYATNNILMSNNVSNTRWGIDIEYSFENTLTSNTICDCTENGIRVVHSPNSAFDYNTIHSNENGIEIINSSHNTLYGNNVNNNKLNGITIDSGSDFNSLIHNKIKNNKYGVSLIDSDKNAMKANIICDNTVSDIYLDNSHDNSGSNNYCSQPGGWDDTGATGCTNSCDATPLCAPGEVIPYDDMEIRSNIKLCPGFYHIHDSGTSGVIIITSEDVLLDCSGATLNGTGSGYGIYNHGFDNVRITYCTMMNYDRGIFLDASSDYNTLGSNFVSSNDEYGIELFSSFGNTIIDSIIDSNGYHGIFLFDASNNTILGNRVTANNYGIYVFAGSDNNEIMKNEIRDNLDTGVYISNCDPWGWCPNGNANTKIERNKITNNARYGIFSNASTLTINLNTLCGNGIFDLRSADWQTSSGDENTCDKPDGWDDFGTTGCTYACIKPEFFDIGSPNNPYPSITGTHYGTITPNQTITVSKLHTYPCPGTGGHTESIKLYESGDLIAYGNWSGYRGDWKNITLHNVTGAPYVTLLKDHKYNYTIKTGSYPQIIHESSKEVAGGTITCTSFVDANSKKYTDWIPAIRLE